MKYVSPLSAAEVITLNYIYKYHRSSQVRSRAHGILLSDQGFRLQEIARILFLSRQSVSKLFDSWENQGLGGLYDLPRTGRPSSLSRKDKQWLSEEIKKEPRSIKRVLQLWISDSTLKRFLKTEHLRWKRVRTSLKAKRDEQKFRQAQQRIQRLRFRQQQGEIDLYYFNEAGFSLEPYVPYAWQPEGENIEVSTARSSRFNVLGFLNTQNDLTSFIFKGSLTTEVVIACLDEFSHQLTNKTFLIINNASIHKSERFKAQIHKWYQRGLVLRFVPPYAPKLNLIEILWRKIKYEWLPFSAYQSLKTLEVALEKLLRECGNHSRLLLRFKNPTTDIFWAHS